MATLTTVVSRIAMMAPSTTTAATESSARSSGARSGGVADTAEVVNGVLAVVLVQDRKQHAVHELDGERLVERLGTEADAAVDQGRADIGEQLGGAGGDLAAS